MTYPRTSFLRMWTLIQNNYATYFGRYKTDFPPELMLAIFWEENIFTNGRQNKGRPGQTGIGFGQVQEDTIKSVNKYWFEKNAATAPMTFVPSEILQDDQQSVQIAGLTLAMLYEIILGHGYARARANALAACRNYAGPTGHPNRRIPDDKWEPCRNRLAALNIDLSKITARDPAFISGVLGALQQARGFPPSDPQYARLLFP